MFKKRKTPEKELPMQTTLFGFGKIAGVAVGAMALSLTLLAANAGAATISTGCTVPDTNTDPMNAPLITTCFFDLTVSPSMTPDPTTQVTAPDLLLNGGLFRVPAPGSELGTKIVGTGNWQAFVRIQEQGNGNKANDGVEAGFNTSGGGPGSTPLLDNLNFGGHPFNRAININDIPVITLNGVDYYQFLLDTNEQGNSNNKGISLDEFKVFTATSGSLTGFTGANDDGFSAFQITDATLGYDMDAANGGDASILMDYRNFQGSGFGVDLEALVPVTNFAAQVAAGEEFVYLYSKFGWTGDKCKPAANSPCQTPTGALGSSAAGLNYSVDAGFEEWAILKRVPTPSTMLLLGIGAIGLFLSRKPGQRLVANPA